MPTVERIIPVLTYRDIPAAHDFLVRVRLRFRRSASEARWPGGSRRSACGRFGDLAHRVAADHQLDLPLASDVASSGLMVYVDDIDGHFQRARSAGARIDSEPVDQPYGQREYGARDLEGHRWWFAAPIEAETATG